MPTLSAAPCLPSHFPSASPCLSRSALFPPNQLLFHRILWNSSFTRRSNAFVCEIAVEVDNIVSAEDQTGGKAAVGSRVRVVGPFKVFHVPKHPGFDLGGCEGEIKDVLKSWKGKRISANLPYKVLFVLDMDGKQVKVFAHLKENEFEVMG